MRKRELDNIYLLTGKLFCGKCENAMTGVSGHSKSGEVHNYYVCRSRKNKKGCDLRYFRRDELEEAVASVLKTYVLNPDVIDYLVPKILDYQRQDSGLAELDALKDQLADTKKRKKNLLAFVEQEGYRGSIQERLAELDEEAASLSAKITHRESSAANKITEEQMRAFIALVIDGDVHDKRYQALLINAFLVKAYVYDDKFKLIFSYTGNPNSIDVPFSIKDVNSENQDCTLLSECSSVDTLVEMRGVEPLSENIAIQPSPSADDIFCFASQMPIVGRPSRYSV